MKKITTILYLYYNQPKAVEFLKSIGCDKYDVNFVFVDDGSKVPLKLDWNNAKVLRIEKDIAWNMPAANNLGFKNITGRVLRLDMDHFITHDQVEQLNKIKVEKGGIILFPRYRVDKDKIIKANKNIYMINVDDYWKVGGYDEEYCGNYGYEDKDIRRRFDEAGYEVKLSDLVINVDIKFSTKGLNRDLTINKKKNI